MENWLYDDEAETANKSTFISKLDELKKFGEPCSERLRGSFPKMCVCTHTNKIEYSYIYLHVHNIYTYGKNASIIVMYSCRRSQCENIPYISCPISPLQFPVWKYLNVNMCRGGGATRRLQGVGESYH